MSTDSRELSGAQIVCESLLREGVDVVFGLPGGAILPLYGVLGQYPLRHILVRHEQGAAHAADGYSRATGKVGVAFATSGPGATNLITGLATAMMDSSAVVAITGQVGRAAIGRDAFQETDITGATLPVTKHNYLVMHAGDLERTIKEAFHIARTGRPGPVLIDIPKDVFQEMATYTGNAEMDLPGYNPPGEADTGDIDAAVELIDQSERPVILAGHGVLISHASEELREFAERAEIPVITSLLGISGIATDHPLHVGMPGMHGVAYASIALDEADLIIAAGARFDDRITGDTKRFALQSKKIHMDVDPAEIDKNVKADVALIGDLKMVLGQLVPALKKNRHTEWLRRIEHLKAEHPSLSIRETDELLGQHVVKAIADATGGGTHIVTGVGQHQMWAAQFSSFDKPNRFHTSGGLGTMGFEVPAAMGVQVGVPDEVVWSIAGDGGFQMTMAELATLKENNIPVKYAILNNNQLGMITQWQDFVYNKDFYANAYTGNPDFVKLAEAFGIKGLRASSQDELESVIKEAMAHDGPVVIDFQISQEANVYPMIPAGESISELIEEPV
ncbi:MAG: biosynthetic-type acetolactate synthase large subunit [Chloroflexi bacterium]|nr:biosynthetic-type acetolactate synthase large subunit [Chloroflexota bacterium]